MKKTLSLILALVLVLSCTAAFAGTGAGLPVDQYASIVNPELGTWYGTVNGDDAAAIENGATEYIVLVYPVYLTTGQIGNVPAQEYGPMPVNNPVDLIWTPGLKDTADWDDAEQEYLVMVVYNDDPENPTIETGTVYVNDQTDGKLVLASEAWYPNNTACVFGPKMDGSWKTYAAVDLSVEGTQTLKLIGAGAWNLGKVTVTVAGDEVVVNYLMNEDINTKDVHDDITVDSEYVNIYADVESMDIAAESAYAFGQPISIENDLAGDTTVVLYVQLQVDYPVHCPFVYRFWPNLWQNKAIVNAMTDLLEAELVVEEEVAE